MFRRSFAATLLVVSLLVPIASGSVRNSSDDQGSFSERIVRFIRTHIPSMFVPKVTDDPVVTHP